MNDITIVDAPDLTDKRHAFVMREERVGHYAEFRGFFSQASSHRSHSSHMASSSGS